MEIILLGLLSGKFRSGELISNGDRGYSGTGNGFDTFLRLKGCWGNISVGPAVWETLEWWFQTVTESFWYRYANPPSVAVRHWGRVWYISSGGG